MVMETRSSAKRALADELHMQYIKNKVVVQNCCQTNYIGNINRNLTEDQRSCIGKTPFAWMMKLECDVKISKELLKEMCCRWVDSSGGFLVKSGVVEFTLADVCLGLGLRTRGRMFDLTSQPADSPTRTLFGPKAVNIKMLHEKLIRGQNLGSVEDFCRLYILLGMAEFLLPNTNGTVCSGLFSVVDNLEDMCEYNWADVVRGYLVKSIRRVSTSINNEECSSIFLLGCSYLLQLWVVHHLVTTTTNTISRIGLFPRILNLQSPSAVMDDNEVSKAFNSYLVIENYFVSAEEKSHYVVYETWKDDEEKLKEWGRLKVAMLAAIYAGNEAVLKELRS